MKKITIAIDGYSSSGKSTMARELARRIGYVYIDSGAMYRAVTLYALEHGMASPDTGLNAAELVKALPPLNRREPTECSTPCWMAAMWRDRSATWR